MNKEETTALQLLTGKAHLDEVSVEEIEQMATDYPYFSIAQLLLCKKMQQDRHPDSQQQLYKTALYFPDEPWLRYLLLPTKDQKSETVTAPDDDSENHKEIAKPTAALADTSEATVALAAEQQEPAVEMQASPIEKENSLLSDGQEQEREDNNLITLPVENSLEEMSASDVPAEPEEMPLDEEELAQQTEPLPIEESNQKIASLLSEQAEAFHKPVEASQPLLAEAEPYHTIDYFASQGIKLDAKKEENGFDKKVHKFTDWLRQMKRINPQPVDLGTGAEEETHIVNIAASSNQTKEIVTESMAEVLLKQNKRDKALEIYEKLSLLYPSKNAYFAAKIQQLKQ